MPQWKVWAGPGFLGRGSTLELMFSILWSPIPGGGSGWCFCFQPPKHGVFSGWWFQIIFYVHPCLGKIPILTNIFQRGGNHQLVLFAPNLTTGAHIFEMACVKNHQVIVVLPATKSFSNKNTFGILGPKKLFFVGFFPWWAVIKTLVGTVI